MISKNKMDYRGLNKDITKEDLNEEELECYNKLMEGISVAPEAEKEEVTHLMEVFIKADEEVATKCIRCGKDFEDNFDGATKDNKRVYCDQCLKKMWSFDD